MKYKYIEHNEEYEVEFSGTFIPGYYGEGPNFECSGGEPSEPAEIEDLCVRIFILGEYIDITDFLNKRTKNYFEEVLLLRATDG